MSGGPYPTYDPRAALAVAAPPDVSPTATTAAPVVVETARAVPDETRPGERSWYVRGRNFCVGVSELSPGARLGEDDVPDEHVVLLARSGAVVHVEAAGSTTVLDRPGLVIVPAGRSTVMAQTGCTVLRIFSARATAVLPRVGRASTYPPGDTPVTPLPTRPTPAGPGTLRSYPIEDVPVRPGTFGRIFRTDSLMVNWFPTQVGPRDTEQLSPHAHADFEQCSVTLEGRYVHDLRTPWTPQMSRWRPDEHRTCESPSITVIPPTLVHTTRAIDEGRHQLVDVFAPPRADFAEQGWVRNAGDY